MVSVQRLVSRRLERFGALRAPALRSLPVDACASIHRVDGPPAASATPPSLTGADRLLLDYGLGSAAALPVALVPPVCESVVNK